MVVKSADESTNNAKKYTTCDSGYCLKYVRTWLEIGSQQESAIDAWNAAKKKHPGDRNPPRGAPCFYRGGKYGHIVLSLNNRDSDNKQMIRSTDAPSRNKVTSQTIDWCTNNWGYEYLGWTEDLNGVTIPYLEKKDDTPWQSHGDVYVSKLHKGQQDSDSVARLCYRLIHHDKIPGSHRPPKQVRTYNQEILEAVRYWQKNIMNPDKKGPKDGTSMSNQQANALFGDNYNVIEE